MWYAVKLARACPLGVRACAACRAQVAVRSEEPYRLQCYGFLAAVASPDILGAHCEPASETLVEAA